MDLIKFNSFLGSFQNSIAKIKENLAKMPLPECYKWLDIKVSGNMEDGGILIRFYDGDSDFPLFASVQVEDYDGIHCYVCFNKPYMLDTRLIANDLDLLCLQEEVLAARIMKDLEKGVEHQIGYIKDPRIQLIQNFCENCQTLGIEVEGKFKDNLLLGANDPKLISDQVSMLPVVSGLRRSLRNRTAATL